MTEIRNGRKVLITPVTADDISSLHAGDVFYLDGDLVTGRDSVHGRVVDEGLELPVDIRDKAILHAGPIIKTHEDGSYEMISVGPTTSMRMERFEYEFIRETGIRIIIGKGGMDDTVREALIRNEALYVVATGGCAALYVDAVEEIESVDWLDLGMPEAMWNLKVKDFGPLIVAMDCHGNSLYD